MAKIDKKDIKELVQEAAGLQIGTISVGDCCATLYGIAEFIEGFAGYITEHAGEDLCLTALSLVAESLTDFLGEEQKMRAAVLKNYDKIFSSAAPRPGSPVDMLNILMRDGKFFNPNNKS